MVWDDYYGPISPGEIVGRLESRVKKIDQLNTDVEIPPHLERLFEAYHNLYVRAGRLIKVHNKE